MFYDQSHSKVFFGREGGSTKGEGISGVQQYRAEHEEVIGELYNTIVQI